LPPVVSITYATVGGRLVREVRNSVITRYVSDPLGSVIQTRNSSGTLTSSTEFWPFGEVRTSSGTNPSPWGFVGTLGYYADITSRLYVRARMYRPNLSRWMTVDPLWPGEAAFVYAYENPTLKVDPTGRQAIDPSWTPDFTPVWTTKDNVTDWLCNCISCLNKLYDSVGQAYNGSKGFNNAMRHCVGSCLAVHRCGPKCARLVYLHEPQSWRSIEGLKDSTKDLTNNGYGFWAGSQVPRVDCHKTCGALWNQGYLL